MFTGIIDHCGMINDIVRHSDSLTLTIACQFNDLQAGESIAVDGICLTVDKVQTGQFTCDISPETLKLTTAQLFKSGQRVNIERALRPSDRLSGHFVLGHVDLYAQLERCEPQGDFTQYVFGGLGRSKQPYLASKGCVAVNGVSLTINEVMSDGFSVMIIPHTRARTNLIHLEVGDKVNIEFDYLAKIVLAAHEFSAERCYTHRS
ncbi:MAG: riboflavin synthase [Gammaproteobacteria bacterium]